MTRSVVVIGAEGRLTEGGAFVVAWYFGLGAVGGFLCICRWHPHKRR